MGFENDSPNFILHGDKAYTEDKATDHELRDYFGKFGELAKVCVRRGHNSRKQSLRVGFINFVDYKPAAKVLHIPFHFINGHRIGVKSCDSWHQPGVDNIQYYEKDKKMLQHLDDKASLNSLTMDGTEECNLILQTAPIFRLNDDCLEIICQKLPLKEQLQFARTCQRFRNVFIMLAKIEYKRLFLDNLELLTLWEIRDLLQMVGDFIVRLEGSIPRNEKKRIIEFLGTYCRKVTSIHIHATKFSPSTMKKLLYKMESVTSLRLYDVALNDNTVQHFRCLKDLKVLHLTENYEVTGRFMDSMESLEELSLHGCANIQPTYFFDFCRKLKHVRILDIQRCGRLNNLVFEGIVKYCRNIEVLKMSCSSFGFECVAKLPKLTHLDLLAESLFRSPIFNLLVTHHAENLQCLKLITYDGVSYDDIVHISQLENLRIFACPNNSAIDDHCLKKLSSLKNLEEINLKNCKSFSRDGLLWLLRCCKQLKRINIVQCLQLKEDLIHSIITILQKEEVPKVPLLIIAVRSGIPRLILEDKIYKSNMNRINISIDVPFHNYEFYDDFDGIYDLFNESDFDEMEDDDMDNSEELFYMGQYMPDESDDEQFYQSDDDPYFELLYVLGDNIY